MFGDLPVQAVDTGLVMKALEPIWTTKPETATRVRGADRIGARLGDDPRLSARREPGALEGSPRRTCCRSDPR